MNKTILNINKFEKSIFFISLIAILLYVITIPVFVTQDGPSHVANAKLFIELCKGNPFYSTYLEINQSIFPNWFSTILLAGLLFIFSPEYIEKVFLILYFISFAASLRYCLTKINFESKYLSILFLLFSFNYFLFFGFYNFQWSIVFFLLFIGISLNDDTSLNIRLLKLMIVSILCFFTHPVMYIFIGIYYFLFLAFSLKKGTTNILKSVGSGFILVPSLILFYIYFKSQHPSDVNILNNNLNWKNFLTLGNMNQFFTIDIAEIHFFKLFVGFSYLFILIGIYKFNHNKHKISRNVFTCLVLICAILFFSLSDWIAGGFIFLIRLNFIFFILLTLWFASFDISYKLKSLFLVCITIMNIALFLIRYPVHREIGQAMYPIKELSKSIQKNSILLPIEYSVYILNGKSFPKSYFLHSNNYFSLYNDIITINNYEASTKYFPVKWKEKYNPYLDPKCGNIEGGVYAENFGYTRKKYDYNLNYIYLWGYKTEYDKDSILMSFKSRINDSFDKIKSVDNDMIQIYKKK